MLKHFAELFFWEKIPLSAGGVIEMGIRDASVSKTLLNYIRLLTISRKLDERFLRERFPSDIKFLKDLAGYDNQQAELEINRTYAEFRQEVSHNATLMTLLDTNFTVVSGAGGELQVGFKPTVIAELVSIPEEYWDNSSLNAERAANLLIPLPEKTRRSPAEQKMALFNTLISLEPQMWGAIMQRYLKFIEPHIQAVLQQGVLAQQNSFRGITVGDSGTTGTASAHRKRRVRKVKSAAR